MTEAPLPLDGRRALVTGANTGIGQGIAAELARQGADVAFCYIGRPDGSATQALVEEHGRSVFAMEADLRDPGACADVVASAATALGGLDLLVSNAGVTAFGPIDDVTPDGFAATFDVNVRAYVLVTAAAMPHLRARREGASIVNISSVHARRAMDASSVYAASKGAVESFTTSLANELAGVGIRVNAVAPGVIEVPRFFVDYPAYQTEHANASNPVGRVGRPADIANAVCFLSRDDSSWITGQVLTVDGGASGRLWLGAPDPPRPTVRRWVGRVRQRTRRS